MDDFLLDAPKSTYTCGSVQELQLHFSSLREAKVTETRAEHISATFEFRPTVVFNVPENENDAADANQDLEPALGGSAAAMPDAPEHIARAQSTREIRANDSLVDQPTDDPALQKAVAKHIITSLGSVDGSSWIVRSVSRSASGWTFQYICKNSTQAWQRQNSKNTAKQLVGESSGKDGQDPVNLSRPAFDCRGSVTIAFVKNNRLITAKLEHTPFHKTVAELAELYKPPPPPAARAEVARQKNGEGKKRKSQAADGAENGEESPKKKRTKKSDNPDEPTVEGEQAPKPNKSRAPKANRKSNGAGVQAQGDDQPNALLNLSPSEAARRRDEAVQKLRDSGIDPATLSTEQFDIFSNQSPDLQNESLAMLVKYGAERLRIVHPTKDDASSSPAPANGAMLDGSVKKKSRKKTVNEDGTPRVKKTRGSCQACRAKKTKCSKAKPECAECIEAGIACYYPPAQKRKLANNPAEEVEAEPQEHVADVPVPVAVPTPVEAPPPVAVPEPEPESAPDEEASDLGSPGFHTQPPDTSSAFPGASHNLYHPATAGLSYPQAVPDEIPTGMDYSTYSASAVQQHTASSGMAYPHQSQQASRATYPNSLSAPPPSLVPVPEPSHSQPVPAPAQPAPKTGSRSGSRRNLPSGSGHPHHRLSSPANTDHASSWQPADTPVSNQQNYAGSSITHSRSRSAANPSAYDTPSHEGLQAAASLSPAALQKAHPSPSARTASPFRNPSQTAQGVRAKSRQGQRSQTRTMPSPFQQTSAKQSAAVDTGAVYNPPTAPDPNNLANFDQYSRFNTATTQSNQASSQRPYDLYPQQPTSGNSSTSYPNYDAYNARSQASTSQSRAAPVTQSMSTSYTKTAAPSPTSWSSSTNTRNNTSYGTSNAATTSNPAYSMPASSGQQQAAPVQSFNVRPQSTAHTSRKTTPSSYTTPQHTQQPRQQQQSYNAYSSQSHSSSNQPQHQQQTQQQNQQNWYGFGTSNNANPAYGSNSRDSGYGQPASASASYGQHRAMDLSGTTYVNDQELYEMLRNNASH